MKEIAAERGIPCIDLQEKFVHILQYRYPDVYKRQDVGFGKTEVAFRAVYLCVLAGKQAALMCPSTILCNQHFNTACGRFADFGVRVAALNRFNSPKEQEKILRDLSEGKIDFVIGTHRLLSGDVKFRELGLLVLDEEQRFGVEHKDCLLYTSRCV